MAMAGPHSNPCILILVTFEMFLQEDTPGGDPIVSDTFLSTAGCSFAVRNKCIGAKKIKGWARERNFPTRCFCDFEESVVFSSFVNISEDVIVVVSCGGLVLILNVDVT